MYHERLQRHSAQWDSLTRTGRALMSIYMSMLCTHTHTHTHTHTVLTYQSSHTGVHTCIHAGFLPTSTPLKKYLTHSHPSSGKNFYKIHKVYIVMAHKGLHLLIYACSPLAAGLRNM